MSSVGNRPRIRWYAKKLLGLLRPNAFRPFNRIEISRDALLHNLRYVQQQHPDFEIIPVLKGNAYGHGIAQIAKALRTAPGRLLAVDGYFEAQRLRDVTDRRILVMGAIRPENARLLDAKGCSFVVQDVVGLHALGALDKPVRVHLELNTGMNRLGLRPEEVHEYLAVLRGYPKLHLEGVMTHLADADNEDSEAFTVAQVKRFDDAVEAILGGGFTPELIHIAQTAGSVKAKSRFANGIRLGLGLYGINPLQPKDRHYADLQTLRPVLELKSTIIKVIELQKGDRVSYNGIFMAPKSMRIGVLPLGYYEGVPRVLSNKGVVTSGDHDLPIVGRVCMDHTMVSLEGTNLQAYDEVTVIGSDPSRANSVRALQDDHDLFSYSTLTGLSDSIRREIV